MTDLVQNEIDDDANDAIRVDRPKFSLPERAIHVIDIEALPVAPLAQRQRFRVWHDGRVLIEATRDPEHEACRALLALGLTGQLQTTWCGKKGICAKFDIETAAQFTTSDADNGTRTVRWKPFDGPSRLR